MAATWRFDRFSFDPDERLLSDGALVVPLGSRALDVLRVLVEHAGQLVPKPELLDQAWPGLVVEENNLQVQVSALRKALGHGAIVTVPGRGYRFEWTVSRNADVVPASATAAALHASGLPAALAPLVGRGREVAELVALCAVRRLVTVVGPGGIGKTRLAIDAAQRLLEASTFARIVFCDLTSATDGSLVATALAAAAGTVPAEGDAATTLLRTMRDSPGLLVVDNAEHVVSEVAAALGPLLAAAPACHALVTSQVPLELVGEFVFRVEPLALPAPDASLAEASAAGSVALFAVRVRELDRHFRLGADNIATIANICRRLDGIPLAIQFAAARVPQLGPQGLEARLDQRLKLLARRSTQEPTRQQTLAAALDWSYALLDQEHQSLLRRLGTFTGEFSLADAIAIGEADEEATTDRLSSLIDRSLVMASHDTPPRYRLLESVRMFALEQLVDAGEIRALETAIAYLIRRGDALATSSGEARAALDYAAALDLCARLVEGSARDTCELELLLKLGPAVQASASPGSRRCEAIYARAVELARRTAAGRPRFKALWGYWHFLAMAGRDREAAGYSAELTGIANALDDDGLRLEANHARFSTALLLGDARATLEQTQEAIARYDRRCHHALTHEFGGHDPGVCALGQGAVALWLVGQPERALEAARAAEQLGASFEHAYSRAVGYYYSAMTHAACGDVDGLARAAHALVNVSGQFAMSILLTEGRLFAGRAAFDRGERAEGLAELAGAYSEVYEAQDFGFLPFYATLLADALLQVGNTADASVVLDQALAVARDGQEFFLPEVHRLRGMVALQRGEAAAALAACREARALADRQGARSLAQRAAISEAQAMAGSQSAPVPGMN